jgi:peroxiredoxin
MKGALAKIRIGLLGASLLLISLSGSVALAGQVKIGEPAPKFTLKSLKGVDLSIEAFKGKVVLLNFWATWCVPCRKEMPYFEKAYRDNKKDGFIVIGVNVLQDADKIWGFIHKEKITFPIALDPDGKTMKLYKVGALPYSLLIDRQGNVKYKHVGLINEKMFDKWIAVIGEK